MKELVKKIFQIKDIFRGTSRGRNNRNMGTGYS